MGESNSFYNDYSVVPDSIARVYTPSGPSGKDQGPYTELVHGTDGDDTLTGGGGYRDFFNAGAGDDLVLGSDGTIDFLYGDAGDDTLRGYGGNDRLRAQVGNDVFDGGDGIDRVDFITKATGTATEGVHVDLNIEGVPQFVSASQGWDTFISIEEVRGSTFNDTLIGNEGGNFIVGGAGAPFTDMGDLILGKGGDDALLGIDGNDTISGGTGADYLEGGDGKDRLDGGSEDDVLVGSAGDDSLIGGSGNDFFDPGEGNDRIDAGSGDDLVESGSGNGNDTIAGGDGRDTIYGGEDNDSASGGAEADELSGRGGNDILNGDFGNDYIAGEDGDDTMRGGTGNDLMLGSIGDDQIFGDANDDWLRGDEGDDTLRGGTGSDIYVQEANTGFGGFDIVVQTEGNATSIDSAYVGSGLYDLNWYREGNDLIVHGAVNENYDINDTGYLRIKDHYVSGSAGLDYFEGDTLVDNGFYTDQSVHPGGIARVYTPTGNTGRDQGGYTEVLWGGTGNDKMQGNGGYRDYMFGDAGNDTLTGSDGTIDHLRGGDGNDQLRGMGGNDRLRRGDGNDVVNGGDGIDRIEFTDASGGITVDLNIEGKAQTVGADQGKDTLIQHRGGARLAVRRPDDRQCRRNFMIGEGGDDTMIGGEGGDFFLGGEGSDIYDDRDRHRCRRLLRFHRGRRRRCAGRLGIIDFGETGQPLSDYLQIYDDGSNLEVFVNPNGGSDEFQQLIVLWGAGGQTVDSLLAQGNLVVDTPVAT